MKSLLDKSFRYTPSFDTSVADTFKRIRKELDAEKKRSEAVIAEAAAVVAKTRIVKRGT